MRGLSPLRAEPVFPLPRRRGEGKPFFKPIAATSADQLVLPEGYRADIVASWDDPLGTSGPHGAEHFGFDNDFIAYFPIDALHGGSSQTEGLLWVNHENANPFYVSRYRGTSPKTEEQIIREKLSVGGSVIHVRRADGKWRHLPGSKHTRRFTALYPRITLTGLAAAVVPEGVGTLANCSGGRTPWHTALSCEENFMDCNSSMGDGEYKGLRWADVPQQKLDETQYGWVVEVDPFGELPPLKHSALGRFAHENTALRFGPTGQLTIYMGDDAQDQFFYKYVSKEKFKPTVPRAEQRKLLTEGTLYAADFAKGHWLPLDLERSPALKDAGFKSQADVLMRAREAALKLGATPIDRPEDCEVHPHDGSVYIALTNNRKHGNLYGQIVRLLEDKDDPAGESFRYEIFLAGGPQTGLACPDNLCFDKKGNLWVACDMSLASLNKGAYRSFGNNGFFCVPTTGPLAGEAFQFASGPVDAELTGPWFTEAEDTLFPPCSTRAPAASPTINFQATGPTVATRSRGRR
jgi:secreted PhoX family phosphatase